MNFKITLFLLAIFFYGCGKDNVVPNIQFEVIIDLKDPKYSNKDVFSLVDVEDLFTGAKIRAGYSGVIVCKSASFIAFEKYCPHDRSSSCNVSIKSDETTKALCNCCKTEYLLFTGEVVHGESKYGLKEYKTQHLINQNFLRIWN